MRSTSPLRMTEGSFHGTVYSIVIDPARPSGAVSERWISSIRGSATVASSRSSLRMCPGKTSESMGQPVYTGVRFRKRSTRPTEERKT